MPRMLDEELLSRLERRWHDLGTPMPGRMEAGLDDAQIDRIAASLPFRLPEEVRRIYRWHSGSSLSDIVFSRVLLPLQVSVEDTLDFLATDSDWKPGWLKFMNEKPYIALDCSGGYDDPVPVWHYDYAQLPPTRPAFVSLGELFLFWISLLDDGYMYWDAPSWRMRPDLPEDITNRLSGVPSD
jgi:SMI1 / KNR4 family (SUKH-1)